MGEFRKDALPDPRSYIESQGLRLVGRGKWATSECQLHGGSDSMRWNLETGGWVCMACGEHGGDVLAYHQKALGLPFVQAAKELGAWIEDGHQFQATRVQRAAVQRKHPSQADDQHQVLAEFGRDLFGGCVPLAGTVGEQYLRARRCALPPSDSDLRFHAGLKHPTGVIGPALVALVTDAVTREPKTLHRTWIRPDGTKADVSPPRLLLGKHSKQGGVVRLWPDEDVTHSLGITEGIETGLSLAHAYTPVWSCLDAGNLSAFPLLRGISSLLIGADNDPAGRKAAQECAARWAAGGVSVRITAQQQNDLNDVLVEEME